MGVNVLEEMKKPAVSCVITSYKRDKATVKRALDSILSQTFQDYEIVIVDDNRGEGADEYSLPIKTLEETDGRVRVIKTEGGHGSQYARNTGIIHSVGRYVAFLDDDDEWLPEKLDKQYALMEENPSAGLCYTDGYRVNEKKDPGKRELIHAGFFNPALTFRELLHEDRIGTTSQAFIRREVFDKCGMFDTDMPARQDYEMWLRISRDYPIKGIKEGLYLYHLKHDEGQITRDWRKSVKAHLLLGEKYKEDIRGDRDAEFNVAFHVAHYYRRGFERDKDNRIKWLFLSLKYYIRSFFISPSYFFKQAGYMIDMIKRKHNGK